MYRLEGTIEFTDGLKLINPNWEIIRASDAIKGKSVNIQVRFWTDDHFDHVRQMLEHDYSEIGTWEDRDLYNALLALPALQNSVTID